METNEKINEFKQIIDKYDNIVFFGGAGVSTESGIPDFRSVDGLYNQKYDYPPEAILSHSFFMKKTEDFYKFYKDKMIIENVQPNITHEALAKLEKSGKLKAVITQNIDGLHQKAGSKIVYELHGSIHRNYCMECGQFYDLNAIKEGSPIPKCTKCGGTIKPDVVLYEESLDNETLTKSLYAIANADVLIIGGTSLSVYPAATLIDYFKGDKLIVINKTPTSRDMHADLVINTSLGDVFKCIL